MIDEGKEREWQRGSRARRKGTNLESYNQRNREYVRQFREPGKNEKSRLRNFLEATLCGPQFICISCHIKFFKHGVQFFTEDLIKEIEEKISIENCIADMKVITRVMIEAKHVNIPSPHKKMKLDVGSRYICKTCVGYLKKGKMPPSSAMNSLILYETDSELKAQDLRLTELEGSLIAQNLLFLMIHL